MKKALLFIAAFGILNQAQAQLIAGANMDTWVSFTSSGLSMNRPTSWITTDSLSRVHLMLSGTPTYSQRVIQSTTVKNGGTSSARLLAHSVADSLPVVLSNSNVSFNIADFAAGIYKFKYVDGTPISARIQKVNAYVYHPAGPDTSMMVVSAYKNGAAVGGGDSLLAESNFEILPNAGFTKITTTLTYSDATSLPTRLVVVFLANKSFKKSTNDTLYVDDVTMETPTGIETPLFNNASIKAYPNPAINQLHISAAVSEELTVDFYNLLGQKMMSQKMTKEADINVANLANGNYTYVISNAANGHLYYSAVFSKQ